jgi:hypothetical protein
MGAVMKTCISPVKNERGSVINIALIVLLLLTVLGFAATYSTNTELKIASNFKSDSVAFYASEGGLEEARARLRGSKDTAYFAGDPASPSNPLWTAYIYTDSSLWTPEDEPNYSVTYQNNIPTKNDPLNKDHTANSLATDMSYLVKIRHKREYDAELAGHTPATPHYFDNDGFINGHSAASPGNIIYYGYGDPLNPMTVVPFTTVAPTEYKPVEIITSYGFKGKSVKMLEIEVVKNPGPKIMATVYSRGDVTVNGGGSGPVIDGTDNCGVAAPKPPVYTKDPATTTINGSVTMKGTPVVPTTGTDDVDIAGYVSSLREGATTILTSDQNGTNLGSLSNFVTVYSDTSSPFNVGGLKMQNVTGYGILLVKGDLILGGGFQWNGLILVTGTLTFNGGGSGVNIQGAILAHETVDSNGGLDIRYDSCMVDSAMNTQAPTVISWKEIY